ncbi:hemin-degrading factor [Atopomonas sediminilitoris]|uniref:hemin-degrading factor n=1 Tax=Atopomonas sediminilitoris TaxID=2919919 RepID=UPI001F4E256B|nr:ChuX/HutX family heme-like substrate-binding protein [Atopomonas sediminilitoris]MCJ8168112.1 hemin-degrading factor [Atopomonas sediminilitoris]
MNSANPHIPSAALLQQWQQLRSEQPRLRAREAARLLSVSEAELLACRLGHGVLRLQADWAKLLPALEALGPVMVLTRNEHCVHERKGRYRETSVMANGRMGLVVSADIDLRLFLSEWDSAFAVEEQSPRGTLRSLQVFDQQGVAVHKVYLQDDSDLAAWQALLTGFSQEPQSAQLALKPAAPAAPERADSEIDVASLRDGWRQLKDTHHFFALINKYGAAREQALRLAGEAWAERLPVAQLVQALENAAQRQTPIMVFVGNKHCIQIHSGPVSNLRWAGEWFNVLDPAFNLHLHMPAVASLWRVRKPSSDGVITSLEAFSADGELVVQLFGARKPGVPELDGWRALAEALPVEEA